MGNVVSLNSNSQINASIKNSASFYIDYQTLYSKTNALRIGNDDYNKTESCNIFTGLWSDNPIQNHVHLMKWISSKNESVEHTKEFLAKALYTEDLSITNIGLHILQIFAFDKYKITGLRTKELLLGKNPENKVFKDFNKLVLLSIPFSSILN